MKLPRLPFHILRVFPLLVLFVVLMVIFPRSAKFSYDYRKGSPWDHETLIAQFDFPLLKTDEQLREERSENKSIRIPYYRYSQSVVDQAKKSAEELELGKSASLRPFIVSALGTIYSNGVVSDDGIKLDSKVNDPTNEVVFIHKDKRVSKKPVSDIYKESDARGKLLALVSAKAPKVNVDSALRRSGAYDLILPNLSYDRQTTDLVNSERSVGISPTQGFVSAGQLIASEGEIVTAEIAQMLDSYKVEYENSIGSGGPRFLFWLGNALIAFILTLLFFLVVYFSNKRIFRERNKFFYLVFIFLLSTASTLLVEKYAPRFLYMVPFTLTALYLEAFFQNKMIIPICLVSLLPLLIFTSNGAVLFVMFIAASVVAIFSFKFFNRGWMQFISAGLVFVCLILTYFGFRFIDMVNDNPYQAVAFLFVGSMLSVAGYSLIFLFERMFNLVSNSRLRELCDTNNPLLRELEHLAPGTFQHSLQVMNMSDVVARSVDANALLVRAGALYHDIGKMKNPQCFIENESVAAGSEHFHKGLSPRESAVTIIRHMADGLELAAKYNLPDIVKDFILTHHGTSCTSYFYNQYLKAGGDPADGGDFFYKGRKPSTKEQIILMVCDSVEAASRTLKDNSPEAFSDFVEEIVSLKMNAGQFDSADISIRDLNTVKDTLKSYLSQLYHERVVYPK